MGSVFAEEILGSRPEVRLMSIGEEPEKGNQLTLDAHELLRRPTSRSREHGRAPLLEGGADVVVADGFTGNVALKTLEGTIKTPARRAAHRARVVHAWEGSAVCSSARAQRLRERLDPETYGGGYLLGLNGLSS